MATAVGGDTQTAAQHADRIVNALQAGPDAEKIEQGRQLLPALRDAREFARLCDLAELICRYQPQYVLGRRLYAQGLIERDRLTAAIEILKSALLLPQVTDAERSELEGLLGRSYKQLFVQSIYARPDVAADFLRQSVAAYRSAYERAPAVNYWHGINLSALAHAAQQWGITSGDMRSSVDYATNVLSSLKAIDTAKRDAFWTATKAEAHIAKDEWVAAEESLGKYIQDPTASPFHLGSTLRQLRDIWRIQRSSPAGAQLLQMLEASLAKRPGSSLEMRFEQLVATRSVQPAVGASLQRVMGADAFQTLPWYVAGLERARAVGALCERLGIRFGTAFAVKSDDFGIEPDNEILLLTNFHVLNSSGLRDVRDFSNVEVLFEAVSATPLRIDVDNVLSESDAATGLDYALFRLRGETSDLRPLPIARRIGDPGPEERVYVVGYPLGNVMQFSLRDNSLLDHECSDTSEPPDPKRRRVQYCAPTAQGSSGSPVFDRYWECIALHHAGARMDPQRGEYGIPALNGKNTYIEANEGIWIGSIQEDVRCKRIRLTPR